MKKQFLHIQYANIECVFHNKITARFNHIPHQRGKNLAGVLGVADQLIDAVAPAVADALERFIIAPLVETVGALVGAAGVASIYFELRTIKDGVGVESLAAAFD